MFTNYSSNREVNNWNKLPSEIVNAESINSFKNFVPPIAKGRMCLYKIHTPLCDMRDEFI